ncbi:MAG: GTP 3',8-cyclase MoaA [Bermanella sp.]
MYPNLQDGTKRQFSYLRLSITDVCNFSCNYCLPNGYSCDEASIKNPLSTTEIRKLVTVFAKKGIRKVRITGGEPSIRRDLVDIIRTVKAISGIQTVALTTNGYKLDENIASWIDAGLDALNVSIDTLDPQVFKMITGHNRLKQILSGLDKAMELGLKKVKVNAILLKSYNINEFERFLEWVKYTPVSLRFIELMETSDNREYFHENHVSGEMLQDRLEKSGWQKKIQTKHSGPAIEYEHVNYAGTTGLILPYSKDFCKSCNRLRISSMGKLHLCLFGDGGLDLRSYLLGDQDLALSEAIDQALQSKPEAHYLASNNTGSTRHLAMLGG